EQDERQLVQRIARLGQLDGGLHERGTGPAGFDNAETFDFEPFTQQLNLRRAAHAVGALDSDELAGISVYRQIGDATAVVAAGLDFSIGPFRDPFRRAHGWSPRVGDRGTAT